MCVCVYVRYGSYASTVVATTALLMEVSACVCVCVLDSITIICFPYFNITVFDSIILAPRKKRCSDLAFVCDVKNTLSVPHK